MHICYYHPGLNQEYLALGIHTFSPLLTEFRKARVKVLGRGTGLLLLAPMEDLLISHDNSLALIELIVQIYTTGPSGWRAEGECDKPLQNIAYPIMATALYESALRRPIRYNRV